MPQITQRDVFLLLTMSLAIVSMSFVFPALGVTSSSSVNATEIPEFNVSEGRFAFAGESPDKPGTPTSGTMFLNTSAVSFSDNVVWLEGSTSGGYEMVLLDNGADAEIRINEWNSSGLVGYSSVNVSAGGRGTVSRDGYELAIEATDSFNSSDGYYEVEWEVREQPAAGGAFIGRIPVVGGLFETADALAGIVGWIGAVIYWIGLSFVEFVLNAGVALFEITTYLFGMMVWLSTTYTAIVSASSSWAAVFLALPGVIFSAVAAKFVAVGISLLPTT
jgi:hypothetical protein